MIALAEYGGLKCVVCQKAEWSDGSGADLLGKGRDTPKAKRSSVAGSLEGEIAGRRTKGWKWLLDAIWNSEGEANSVFQRPLPSHRQPAY